MYSYIYSYIYVHVYMCMHIYNTLTLRRVPYLRLLRNRTV